MTRMIFLTWIFPVLLLAGWQDALTQGLDKVNEARGDSGGDYKNLVASALEKAVKELSERGYLKNASAKIPLPQNLQKAAELAKKVGGEKWAKDLSVSMNSAATSAVSGAAGVFSKAIQNMSDTELKEVIDGGNDSFTGFLRDKSGKELEGVFKPIIKKMMSENRFATAYNGLNSYMAKGKLMKSDTAKSIKGIASKLGADDYLPSGEEDLNDYITRKTLDGLFIVMGEKEKSLRSSTLGKGAKALNKLLK